MKTEIYGKRAKPGAWPSQLLRVVESAGRKRVEYLVHGIWAQVASQTGLFATVEGVNREVAKGGLHLYDRSVWSEMIDDRVSNLIENRELIAHVESADLGDVADGRWGTIMFHIISKNVFRVHGENFVWVQRSKAAIDYPNYPHFSSIAFSQVETSLFKTAIAAKKQFEEYRNSFGFNYTPLSLHSVPERLHSCKDGYWITGIREQAKRAIRMKADEEKERERRKQREREERERAERERVEAEKRRVAEEKERERKRARVLLDKPVQDLSPEEFAKRMRMRREKRA
jgi:hypothetical protein